MAGSWDRDDERATPQKDRIRRAAADLWARQGYHASGIQQLSEVVGLGRAALYHHIGSKEDLLYEISTLYVDELVAQAEQSLASEGISMADKLRGMSRGLMRNIVDNMPEWTVFFHEANTLTGARRTRMVAHRERYEALWRQIIEQGVMSGEFRDADPVIVKGVLGMHNYAYLWVRADSRLTPEQIADVFTDMILQGIASSAL